jgi:hypothetical protein
MTTTRRNTVLDKFMAGNGRKLLVSGNTVTDGMTPNIFFQARILKTTKLSTVANTKLLLISDWLTIQSHAMAFWSF